MKDDLDKYTYERAIAELDEIVNELETGKAPLDQSVDLYQRGVALTRYCEKLLNEAENKIMIVTDNSSGDKVERPFLNDSNRDGKENLNESN